MNLDNPIAVRSTKTVYRDGNKTIKLFNEGYSKPLILNEALNLARVEDVNLNIPKLLGVEMEGNRWAIVTEYIEGESLENLMKQNPERIDEYMNLFVDIQIEIQSIPAPAMLNRIKEKMKNKIADAPLNDTIKYDLSTRLEGMPTHSKLCHGDFNPGNVIIKEDGTHYIIDWAHVTRGNASADAARTYLIFSLNGKTDMAEKYLDIFTEKSGISKRNVQRWIPIVAASQLSKRNEGEEEFLMRWLDVVEYE